MSYTPIAALPFKQGLQVSLRLLGAQPAPHAPSLMVLPTQAGPMAFEPSDRGFQARLAQPQNASLIAPVATRAGKFDATTGKWIRAFARHDSPEDLRELFLQLLQLPLEQQHGQDVHLDLDGHTDCGSTRLVYQYRDGANYKTAHSVVVEGRMSPLMARAILACCDADTDASFVPGQVGLPDLQDSFSGCDSYWDPDLDHPFHEVLAIELTREPANLVDSSDRPLTTHDLMERFLDVGLAGGWNDDYLPPFHAEMAQRYQRGRTEVSAGAAEGARP